MGGNERGFTLIELIVVIIILGILAAVALPKFVNLGTDARKAVIQGVDGSMRAANAMIFAKAAAANALGAGPTTISVGSANVAVEYGFASTVSPDLVAVMDLSPLSDFNVNATNIQHAKATTPGSCQIAYAKATGVNTPPQYTPTSGGC